MISLPSLTGFPYVLFLAEQSLFLCLFFSGCPTHLFECILVNAELIYGIEGRT